MVVREKRNILYPPSGEIKQIDLLLATSEGWEYPRKIKFSISKKVNLINEKALMVLILGETFKPWQGI
jgi:hypothetical protein